MYRDHAVAGGSLRVGETLTLGLRRLEVDARACFAYGTPGPLGARLDATVYLGLSSSRDVKRWPLARSLLKRFAPDVVHYIDPVIWMQAATLLIPVPTVVHIHGGIPAQKRLGAIDHARWAWQRFRADQFVCITEGARRSMTEAGLLPASKTRAVYNSVDFEWFQHRPSRDEARRRLGLPQQGNVAGMVCRLFEAKGCDDFLSLLLRLGDDWHGLLVGDGPERNALESRTAALGLRDRVHFVGSIDDVRPAYAAMDIFLFLSLYEPFGLSTAEAMASRVPVFGLRGGGEYDEPDNPLLTADNASLLWGRPRRRVGYGQVEDPVALDELAQLIKDRLSDSKSLSVIVDTAQAHVRERFSVDAQVRNMRAIYRTMSPSFGPST